MAALGKTSAVRLDLGSPLGSSMKLPLRRFWQMLPLYYEALLVLKIGLKCR